MAAGSIFTALAIAFVTFGQDGGEIATSRLIDREETIDSESNAEASTIADRPELPANASERAHTAISERDTVKSQLTSTSSSSDTPQSNSATPQTNSSKSRNETSTRNQTIGTTLGVTSTFNVNGSTTSTGTRETVQPAQTGTTPTPALPGSGTLLSSVTKDGITWTFDEPHLVGQYQNGDFWVQGPVTVTDISPGWTGRKNGSVVNPFPGKEQGFHTDIASYRAELNVADDPKIDLKPNDSLVSTIGWIAGEAGAPKADGNGVPRPTVRSAAVLTVIDDIPAQGSFRPHYSAGTKETFNVNQVDLSVLPTVSRVPNSPTPNEALKDVEKLILDSSSYWNGRYLHPSEHHADYGRDIAAQHNQAGLVLTLDYSDAEKKELAYALIQRGIDLHGLLRNAPEATHDGWWGDFGGGHGVGRKLPILLAGVLLDDAQLKNIGQDYGPEFFGEDCQIRYGNSGVSMVTWQGSGLEWGEFLCTRPDATPSANSAGYRTCCTANVNNAAALTVHLLDRHNPGLDAKGLWNWDPFFDYQDVHMDSLSHGDEWKRGWTPFIRDMWDRHR